MTDLDRDIGTAFARLAQEAGEGRGTEAAELAIARDRRRRRSSAGWAAAAVAVVLVGVGINSIVPTGSIDRADRSVAAPTERSNGV